MSKFKIGDRVVPKSKSVGSSLKNSAAWNKAKKINQPCLYVVYTWDESLCACNTKLYGHELTEAFLDSDLIPFEEIQARIESAEKPPVWYTLPAPAPAVLETEKIEPDYKWFYEFMMTCKRGLECKCCVIDDVDFCICESNLTCLEVFRAYAENKFIKRG
ncbi:MAG: hypothetical protein WC389_21555 [Lutibacter sp.]|jgi:hypothetical protein